MDELVIMNCATGAITRRELTPVETTQQNKDREEHARVKREQEVRNTERDNTLVKVAAAAGVSPADLKRALGVPDGPEQPDPARLARRPKREAR